MVLQITFHGIPRSEALDKKIRARAEKLTKFHDRITRCKVVATVEGKHGQKGAKYEIRIALSIPKEKTLAVTHESNEDIYAALGAAFDTATRRLEDHVRSGRQARRGKTAKNRATRGSVKGRGDTVSRRTTKSAA